MPPASLLPERTAGVLAVLYLLFNEGYSATSGADMVRADLCAEAIRLARLLARLMPGEPEAGGLLALMLLQDSRRAARTDAARRPGHAGGAGPRPLGPAPRSPRGSGSCRARCGPAGPGRTSCRPSSPPATPSADKAADTDWPLIARVYGQLGRINPSPVVELNRAVAVGMAQGPRGRPGAARLAGRGRGAGRLPPAARRPGRPAAPPRAAGRRRRTPTGEALALCGTDAERRYLTRRLAEASGRYRRSGVTGGRSRRRRPAARARRRGELRVPVCGWLSMRAADGVEAEPARGEHPLQVTVADDRDVAVAQQRPDPVEDRVCARGDLLRASRRLVDAVPP